MSTAAHAADWDGFYAGLGLSGAYNVNLGERFGFVDGIVGVNAQLEGDFVVGAEVALSGWISDAPAGPGLSASGEVRGGFLVTPDVLLYGSAGAMHFISGGATYLQVGAGAEFAVADNMSLDLQYKYWVEMPGVYRDHSLSASLLWHFE